MSLLVDNFWVPYRQLEKLANFTSNEMKVLKELFVQLKDIYVLQLNSPFVCILKESFADSLRALGEKFHVNLEAFTDISQEGHNDERVFPYYQYLGNQLLKISEVNKDFSQDVESIIVTPYSEFSMNIERINSDDLEKISKTLNNLEISSQTLRKYQEEYYKQSKNVDKLQESFSKMVDDNKSEDQLQKAQDRLLKVKMDTQEAGNLYRKQIDSTNQLWKILYSDYTAVFKHYDENEESRSFFTQNTISNVIKFFTTFYSKTRNELYEDYEEKLKEFNEKFKSINSTAPSKSSSFNLLNSGNVGEQLKKQPLEAFLSYEAKKKMDELALVKYVEKEEYTVVYGASNETDLQFILNFLKNFLPKELLQEPSSAGNNSTETSILSENIKEKSDITIKIPLREEDDKRLKEVLANPANRKFLLDNLGKARDSTQNVPSTQVRLMTDTFDFLKDFLLKVFKEISKEKDYETLSAFLVLTTKYYTIRNGLAEFLHYHLRSQAVWQNPAFWAELVGVLVDKKMQEENLKLKKGEESDKEQVASPLMNKLWKFGMKTLSSAFEANKPKNSMSEKEAYSCVMDDICFYLSRLTQNTLIASEVLMTLGKEIGYEKEEIESLIRLQQKHRDGLMKKKVKNHKVIKKMRSQIKWNQYHPFYLALDFLDIRDLLKFLQLNKDVRKIFKKKIYRTIFYNFGEKITQEQRYRIWCNALEIDDLKIDFHEIVDKCLRGEDKITTRHDNVIKIDVVRSFNNHKDFDSKLLEDLLRAYALLDKDVSYCQGMNYVMGFCYINLKDPNLSFKCFIRLMDWYLKALFEEEFKLLKVYFFKFNRMIELYMPELAEHFKREKIEASFFVPSWFITIFASIFQHTPRSKLLEKIWDFFILDGFKVVFKTALLIVSEYKQKLMDMKFDGILNFMGDLGREEIFTNIKYFAYVEGKIPADEIDSECNFTLNFGTLMKNLAIPNELTRVPDHEFEVFENKLPKLSRQSKS